MTANSRTRKFKKNKRSHTDVDPYSQRYRAASDAAKAARARADEADRAEAEALNGQAKLVGVSLVPQGEGTGYILEVGADAPLGQEEEIGHALSIVDFHEIVEREERRRDERERFFRGIPAGTQEAVRSAGTLDSKAFVQRGPSSIPGLAPSDPEDHVVFFEKEVGGLIEYSHQEPCDCSRSRDHWTIL